MGRELSAGELFGGKPYLRVLTPQTTDGTNLRYDESNERVIKKETHLPLTARKFLEAENENLPVQLRHIITEVDGSEPPAVKQRGKPGPKPKENDKGESAKEEVKD